MKKAAWILTPLLGLALFLSLGPASQGSHLAWRFLQGSTRETGMAPLRAVLTDYRSFDLLVLTLLAFGSALLGLFPALVRLPQRRPGPAAALGMALALLGLGTVLGLGLLAILSGSNFLDHECLARSLPPEGARAAGGRILAFGAAFCTVGALLAQAGKGDADAD